jgi:hypothetical protein
MAANTAVPTPPRIEGVCELEALHRDLVAIHQYITDQHRSLNLESRLADPTKQQATPKAIVPLALPEPTTTSLSDAQNVANVAFQKAFGLI